MRGGAPLVWAETGGEPIGSVTSGGVGPSVNGPVAMGYVASKAATVGTTLYADLRGKRLPVHVSALPFFPNRYKR